MFTLGFEQSNEIGRAYNLLENFLLLGIRGVNTGLGSTVANSF